MEPEYAGFLCGKREGTTLVIGGIAEHIHLLSLFNDRIPFLFFKILTINMRKLRLKEVQELDLVIY